MYFEGCEKLYFWSILSGARKEFRRNILECGYSIIYELGFQ